MNKKGFTLIELLAVIIILGILMIIAIPSVTTYINNSRKEAYVDTAKEIISGARNLVNEGKLEMYDTNTTYYIPTSCIKTENASKSPYGEFVDDRTYVVVTYDGKGYDYYWISLDDTGTGIKEPVSIDKLEEKDIETDLTKDDINNYTGIGGRKRVTLFNSKCDGKVEEDALPSGAAGTIVKLTKGSNDYIYIDEFGNTRFAGNNAPNYVRFSDSDTLWRIIGVFDGYIKLIDNPENGCSTIGVLKWNNSLDNDWTTSSLANYFNGEYYDSLSQKTRDSIDNHTWNLGAIDTPLYSNSRNITYHDIYIMERGSLTYGNKPCIWTGKIALPYLTDSRYSYNNVAYLTENYITSSRDFNSWYGNCNSWFIDANLNSNFAVVTQFNLSFGGQPTSTAYVRPTFYLKSNISFESGTGILEDPYVID